MGNGWIKLHRKLLENAIARNPSWAWVWVCLLLQANHKPTKMIWNGNILVIKEGQFVTGRKALSKVTGVHESSIERILKFLEIEHQIEQQKTTKYRLITIINWKDYQQEDTKPNNKRTTDEQQANTNKNDKKDNNEKKDIAAKAATPFSMKEEIGKLYKSDRRDLNLIGWYFEKRKTNFHTFEQFQSGLKRHLRAAKQLSPFTDEQMGNAYRYVQVEYPEWTLDTLIKKLTK